MKPTDSKQRVIELRKNHTLSQCAKLTGTPLGTVKTWLSRSRAFIDNPTHRALFTLPPVQTSEATALTVPTLPVQAVVTGDAEIDAVLWLREVIKTGQAALIDKAMLAAKEIKTPLKEVADRYSKLLVSKNPRDWTVAFQTFGFEDLEGLASGSINKATRKHDALSRFGTIDALFADTPAESFARDALKGIKRKKEAWGYDPAQVDTRFHAHPDQLPNTLGDCLYELAYWHDLYCLRNAFDCGDPSDHSYARECFAFRSLARIKPKNRTEALTVFQYLTDTEKMDDTDTPAIFVNLIG